MNGLVVAYRPGPPGRPALALEERPVPELADGEVLLRVDACSICGTDLRIASGGHAAFADGAGRVPGHEVVGTVVASKAGGAPRVGERVFVAPNYGCGACRQCKLGMVNLCERPRATGITEDGGFAQYLLLNRELVGQGNLLTVDGDVEAGALALAEPLACAWRGSQACRINQGDVVVVYGAGPIGLLHVALAKLAGASAVIVYEPNAARRELAIVWGASSAPGGEEDLRDALTAAGATSGADAVIVAAPAPAAQRQALELAAPGGRVNFFAGLPRGGKGVELDTNLIHYKELLVTGTTASTNGSCRAALELIVSGQVDAASLIGARRPLTSAVEAFELAATGDVMKVVVQP